MRTTRTWSVWTGTLLAAGVLWATPMDGQDLRTDGELAKATLEYQEKLDRAVKLEALAAEASLDLQTFEQAAELYREASKLRGASPESVRNDIRAAHLSYYLGDEGDAIGGLEDAARAALSWDDVTTAARTFLDAAWVAQEDGRIRTAIHLAREAEALSDSPLMARAERNEILERIADMDLDTE